MLTNIVIIYQRANEDEDNLCQSADEDKDFISKADEDEDNLCQSADEDKDYICLSGDGIDNNI